MNDDDEFIDTSEQERIMSRCIKSKDLANYRNSNNKTCQRCFTEMKMLFFEIGSMICNACSSFT